MAAHFRYTRESKHWTPEQRLFYEKNGYVVIPRLVPQEILDKCNARFDDIINHKAPRDGMIVMHDVKDRKSVNKIQDICGDEVFREYSEYKGILDFIEAITGPNIVAVHSMLIAKPPDIGFGTSKHPPHQDLYYFPIRPADLMVGVWTAIEPCDRENGCLFVSPGSHALGRMYQHDYPPGSKPGTVNKFYHGILDLPEESMNWVDLEMEPGDTVFFHTLLVHGSGVNRSKRSRRAISCHYGAAECYYIDPAQTVQSTIENEVMDYLKKRFPGNDISYTDVWRYKAVLVRGIRSLL